MYLRMSSRPCWPCRNASARCFGGYCICTTAALFKQQPAGILFTAYRRNARDATLFTQGPQWEEETLFSRLQEARPQLPLFSPTYTSCVSPFPQRCPPRNVTHQSPPLVPPNSHLITVSYCRTVLPVWPSATLMSPFCTRDPSSHSPVQTLSCTSSSFSLWGTVWKEFCDTLWRTRHKKKLYCIK